MHSEQLYEPFSPSAPDKLSEPKTKSNPCQKSCNLKETKDISILKQLWPSGSELPAVVPCMWYPVSEVDGTGACWGCQGILLPVSHRPSSQGQGLLSAPEQLPWSQCNEPTCTQHGPSAFWLLSVVADVASLAPQPQQYITPIMTAMLAFWRMTEIRDLSVEGSSSFSAYFPVFTSMQFYMIQSIRLLSTSSLGWMCHRVVDLTIRTSFLIFCLKFPQLFRCLRKTFCLYVTVKQKRKSAFLASRTGISQILELLLILLLGRFVRLLHHSSPGLTLFIWATKLIHMF